MIANLFGLEINRSTLCADLNGWGGGCEGMHLLSRVCIELVLVDEKVCHGVCGRTRNPRGKQDNMEGNGHQLRKRKGAGQRCEPDYEIFMN